MRDLYWIPRSAEIAREIRAEATPPAPPEKPAVPEPPEHKGGEEQVARVRELRNRMLSDDDPFKAAVEATDDGAPEGDGIPEEFRGAVIETDEQESEPGDPPDSYRDSAGRLRDTGTKKFLPEPTDEQKAAVAAARGQLESASGVSTEEGAVPEGAADLVFEFARPGRDPLKIAVEDQATLDTLKHLQKGYLKGEEVRAARTEIDAARTELREIGEALEQDPINYILGQLPAESHQNVALAILRELPQPTFEAILGQLREWEDEPVVRREQALTAREQRIQRERDNASRQSTRQATAARVQAIGTAVEQLIPTDAPEGDADEFYEFALVKIKAFVQKERRYPAPAEVPGIIRGSGLLTRFGFDRAAATPSDTRKADPATPDPAKKKAATVEESAIKRARTLPEQLRKKAETRKAAAAIAPGGAGAGTSRAPLFKPGEHIRDRLRSARQALIGR